MGNIYFIILLAFMQWNNNIYYKIIIKLREVSNNFSKSI